jgi:pilus assembly protein CpaE
MTKHPTEPLQLESSKANEFTTKVLLVEDNPGDVRLVRETLASQSIARFDLISVSRLGDALIRLRGEPFDAVLLDLSLPDAKGLDTLSRMRQRAPFVPIVVMTGQSDEALAIEAVNEGAQDYLVKGDVDGNALARRIRFAVERTRAPSARALNASQPKPCKTLGFLGSKGGVGTSTLACCLGIALQDRTQEPLLLADFDFESGVLDFLMEIEPKYSLVDVLQNADRLDKDIWNSLVQKNLTGLDVIPSSFDVAHALAQDHGTTEQLQKVISYARSGYRWIVADLGRGFHSKLMGLLEEIDEICVVTTVDLPALRQARLMIQKLLQIGYHPDCIRLLVNELPKRRPFSARDLEEMLGFPVWTTLPYFPELRENHRQSISLSRNAALRKAIDRIAGLIAGIPEAKPKGRWPF